MPTYRYTGKDRAGKFIKGTVQAESPRAGRDRLRTDGVDVQSLTESERSARHWTDLIAFQSSRMQWSGAAHELAMLLRAGVSLNESLLTLASQYRGRFRDALHQMHDDVTAGKSFAEAMRQRPEVFDPASVRLVEVGENAGNLDVVLEDLAELRMRLMQLGNQIATAMMYPVFLLCFGTAAMIFLMTWVLPPLLENLQETLTDIPWPTRVARWLSELLVNHGLLLIIGFVVLAAIGIWAFRQPRARVQLDGWLMRLPLLGPILVKQHLSRVAMVIGLLVRSGITLDEAVNLASKSTSNRIIQQTLGQCVDDLRSGQDLAQSLGRLDWFPPLAARVFAVGQDSGQLDSMLLRLGDDYNQQVKVATSRLTALMEPVLILVMAVLVGFLLVATVLPILQAGQMAQG